MCEEWLKIPGIDGYEVCNEKMPRVRNARTGKVLARNWQNQANMTVNGRCFKRSGDRCLYADINNIDVKSIPHDVLIHYDGSEFVIGNWFDKGKLKEYPCNEVLDREEKITQLDECIEFCVLQKYILRSEDYKMMYCFLREFRDRVAPLVMKHMHKSLYQLEKAEITFDGCISNLISRIKDCKYVTMHPTLALYEEMRKMYHEYRNRYNGYGRLKHSDNMSIRERVHIGLKEDF